MKENKRRPKGSSLSLFLVGFVKGSWKSKEGKRWKESLVQRKRAADSSSWWSAADIAAAAAAVAAGARLGLGCDGRLKWMDEKITHNRTRVGREKDVKRARSNRQKPKEKRRPLQLLPPSASGARKKKNQGRILLSFKNLMDFTTIRYQHLAASINPFCYFSFLTSFQTQRRKFE